MHEVGIAQEIFKIITSETEKAEASSVKEVKIVIGEFTGVVKEALEFAFDVIKRNSVAENAVFIIEIEKLKTKCRDCGEFFFGKEEANFLCPKCGGALKILAGKEMKIEYIDVE